jgi:ubiquinone/menaquinone biosynthesis C-methylase UbiE
MVISLGANPALCYGVDLMAERVEEARRLHPTINFRTGNAERLDFPADEFDLVVLSTLISSILDDSMRHAIAVEAERVLKPGGAVLWYDIRYPSPTNRNVRRVSRREVHGLFPRLHVSLRTVTLLPPLARRLGWVTPILYPTLASVPVLRSHLVGLIIKPDRRC